MNWKTRFALSSLRSQWFAALLAGLIVACGSTAFLSIRILTVQIEENVRSGARDSLGGDLSLSLTRLISPESLTQLKTQHNLTGFAQTRISETLSMASPPQAPERSTLVEIVAVDQAYPLVGGPQTAPAGAFGLLAESKGAGTLVDQSLADSFFPGEDVLGQSIQVGTVQYTILGVITDDPTREPRSLVTGPRVYLPRDPSTLQSLFTDKSRVRDKILFADASGTSSDEAWNERAKSISTDSGKNELVGLRSRSAAEHAQSLFQPLRRFTLVVELAGLATLLLSLFGAAFSLEQLLRLLAPQVALLKALGAERRSAATPLWALVIATLTVGLAVGTLAAALLSQQILAPLFQELGTAVDPELQSWSTLVAPLLLVWGATLSLMSLQLAPQVSATLSTPPLQLLEDRNAGSSPQPSQHGSASLWTSRALRALRKHGPSLLVLLICFSVILKDPWAVVATLGGLFGLLFALWLISQALFVWVARLVPRASAEVQVALLSTLRNRRPYQAFLSTLGFALTLAFFVSLLSGEFLAPLENAQSSQRPNLFFLDIQSSQRSRFKSELEARFTQQFESSPIVRARISAVKGVPASQIVNSLGETEDHETLRRKRFLQREQNVSYTPQIDASTVSEGEAWPPWNGEAPSGAPPSVRSEVSLEEGFAEALDVGVGDTLSFDIQGVQVKATVTSVREVAWESGRLNFFVLAHPSLLEGAPQQHIFAANVPEDRTITELNSWLRQSFANVTFIDVRAVAKRVEAILEKMVVAIQVISSLCLAAAFLIFLVTLLQLRYLRVKDTALLRLLGGRTKEIKRAWIIELCFLAFASCASALALALSLSVGWSLYAFGTWPKLQPAEPLAFAGVTLVLGWALGVWLARHVLRPLPLEALRGDP